MRAARLTLRNRRKGAMRVAILSLVVACAPGKPEPIAVNADACTYCRMLIGDGRFAAAIVTAHGRTLKFDSIECLVAYYRQAAAAHDVASVWVSDLRHPGTLIDASTARFVDVGEGRAPMGSSHGWAAVASARDAAALGFIDAATIKRWSDLQ
ncbi:MAG TPA: nitrous oxide reductase accessory protein NosL [Gemmatimonadaceae bacterium]|jgi:copper chaperone NosL|nr:nitrous oxide reductase accessory protein NosL [Gemmatimonadaceae bacterium]